MCILSDRDILEGMDKGILSIEPFNRDNLTSNGFDLSIGQVLLVPGGEPIKEGTVLVPAQSWFAIGTREYVKFSGLVAGSLWIRSSWARKGVLASFGKVDAGFEGTLTLSAYNSKNEEIEIPIGNTFAQLVFERMCSEPLNKYDGAYKGQVDIKLEK